MVNTVCDLILGIFEQLYITANNYVDNSAKYKYCILAGPALQKYRKILLVCKDTVKSYDGYKWTLGEANDFSMEDFWTWENAEETNADG